MDQLNSTYTLQYCRQLELAYGAGFMSEGGIEEIDKIFKSIDLSRKKILDFGSGLGGIATHLASKHKAIVHGVEINPAMIEEASKRIPKDIAQSVSFHKLNLSLEFPFPDEYFDIVFSKGVIVHLTKEEKLKVFDEFYRVLKAGGTLIIHDWLSPTDGRWSARMQTLIESESLPLYAHSPKTYRSWIEKQGFNVIELKDRSNEYENYNQTILNHLKSPSVRQNFIELHGEKTYDEHKEGYENIKSAYHEGDLLSLKVMAKK